jgi:V-type H+-transporting ATPase subunit H
MSLDPPTYIFSLQNNIRARPISWEGAVRAKTITDADLKKIKSIDKVRKEQRKQTIEADVDSFVALLLGGNGSPSIFEAAAKRQDIIQYMLVLTGDLIDGMHSTCYDSILKSSHLPLYQISPVSPLRSCSTRRPLSRFCPS